MENDQEDKYKIFLQWFTENGGKHCDLAYPVSFPPTNYIGVAATKAIPQNKVIMAIPKKLIISVELTKKSPIAPIFP